MNNQIRTIIHKYINILLLVIPTYFYYNELTNEIKKNNYFEYNELTIWIMTHGYALIILYYNIFYIDIIKNGVESLSYQKTINNTLLIHYYIYFYINVIGNIINNDAIIENIKIYKEWVTIIIIKIFWEIIAIIIIIIFRYMVWKEILKIYERIRRELTYRTTIGKIKLYKNLENKYNIHECVVCIESYDDISYVIQLKCNHIFHENCVNKWIKTEGKCPTCKDNIFT